VLRSGVQRSELARADGNWLISRAICRFRHFDLTSISVREQRAALRNLLLAWSPFDQSAYAVVLKQGFAQAFAWDASNPDLSAAAQGCCWPESLLRPAGIDGLQQIEGLEGCEWQWWHHGQLRASRWWPAKPDERQQLEFLRSLGAEAPGLEGREPVANVSWLGRVPDEVLSIDSLASNWSRMERLAVGVTAVCLAGLTGAQAQALHAAWSTREQAQKELDQIRLAAAPVLLARDAALADARQLDELASELTAPQPIEVLQHLAQILPAKGVTLKDFELNGRQVRLGLALSPDIQRSTLVKELQAGGWFTGVTEQRELVGRDWVSFEMKLMGNQPSVGRAQP